MSFVTASLAERIGTKIEATQDVLLSGEYAETIRALLEQRGVLVFPQVGMDDRAQLAFARSIGQVIPQGEKGIYKVTLDAKITPTAEYLHGTVLWHIDGWADDVPARGSILSGRVLLPTPPMTICRRQKSRRSRACRCCTPWPAPSVTFSPTRRKR